MQSFKKAILFGFLVWLIPFVASFPVISLRENNRALFESIMAIVVTLSVVIFLIFYFKKISKNYLREGIFLGLLWYLISVIIDLPMFLPATSPMHMTLTEYTADIGLTYLIIPIITIGFGIISSSIKKKQEEIYDTKTTDL